MVNFYNFSYYQCLQVVINYPYNIFSKNPLSIYLPIFLIPLAFQPLLWFVCRLISMVGIFLKKRSNKNSADSAHCKFRINIKIEFFKFPKKIDWFVAILYYYFLIKSRSVPIDFQVEHRLLICRIMLAKVYFLYVVSIILEIMSMK